MNTGKTSGLRYFMQPEGTAGSATPYGNNPSHGHYVQAGDVRMYYEIYGKNNTGSKNSGDIVVLHGGSVGCAYEMGAFVDLLQKTHRVILVVTRGHGRSEFGTEPLTYEQKATDVLACMKDAGCRRAAVLGFSDGAYTAYKLAVMSPYHVERIVAIGAGENNPGLRGIHLNLEMFRKLDPAFVRQQQSLMTEPARWDAWLRAYGDFFSRLTVSKETFMSIRCPVLVMAGERDLNAPLATVIAAYNQIPDARLAIIQGAGHGCFLENFAAVWANIEPFLKAD